MKEIKNISIIGMGALGVSCTEVTWHTTWALIT